MTEFEYAGAGTAKMLPQLSKLPCGIRPYDRVFAWLSLPAGFLFVRYIVCAADGFLTTAWFLLAYLFCRIYLQCAGYRMRFAQRITGAVICLFALGFSWTANPLLHGLCFVFLTAALFWMISAVRWQRKPVTRYFPLDLYDAVFASPFQTGAAAAAIGQSLRGCRSAGKAKTVLAGLFVTVPLTAIVAGLLFSADAGIEKLFRKIGSLMTDNVSESSLQLLFGIPAGMVLFGMLYAAVKTKEPPVCERARAEDLGRLRVLPPLGLYAGVTPVCLLYFMYVISQTGYFLSAFAGRLPGDLIYSEYARRGFFELCGITVINLAVILMLSGTAKHEGRRPKALTFYTVLLCVFTLFIIATALAKMCLYVRAYGLTRLRLYTAWFMVLLAAGFLVLTVRQFVRRFPTAAVLTCVFLVLFGGLVFSRPDALIAEYNLTRYEQGTLASADIKMLCSLSEDAYAVLAEHPEAIAQANLTEYWQKKAAEKLCSYDEHPDRARNLSAVRLRAELTKQEASS